MAQYAIIRDTVVENVIEWDGGSQWKKPAGTTTVNLDDAPEGVGIGWTKSGSTWKPPETDEG